MWTRQHRQNASQRSVIDYILTPTNNGPPIKETITDEEGALTLKDKGHSDHNTITIKINSKAPKEVKKTRKWKLTNKAGWTEYNKQIEIRQDELKNMPYQQFIDELRKIMKNTIGEKTITSGKRNLKEKPEVKQARAKVKEQKKIYKEQIKTKDKNQIKPGLEKLIKTQKELRTAIEESQKQTTKEELNKMKSEGGTKANAFWRHRANILGKHTKDEYDTLDEEGNLISDPETAKEHIADFYENLYQARPAKAGEETRTEQIEKETEEIKETMKNLPKPEPIKKKELNKSIKKLKRGKACGPDNIPNEAIIEANDTAREVLRHQLNKILQTSDIPNEWQHGEITRLYKGKGKKGQCSNERGITLASNIGKLFERIINERLKTKIDMTDAQAGGRAGSATTDHLLILSQAIKSATNAKKDAYLGFLDVTKAYDKAWITAIMHILYNRGIDDSHWETVYKLNENLTAKLKTKYGHTRTINIKDSLRQGGVLAVLQYGIMMDQINQAIKQKNLGITIEGTDTQIPSLLWVDDVLIMAETKEELQEMLNVINDIAAKYHIEFGMPKSNIMKVAGKEEAIVMMPLGQQAMTQTTKYKYLGFTQTSKNNLQEHLKATRGKTIGAYQKMLQVAGDEKFKNIELQTIWELMETEIAPIALNTAEVWNPTKIENQTHNKIMDDLIKRTLKVPMQTPRESLYIELGILDLEWRRKRNRINMEHRVNKKGSETTKTTMSANIKGGWKEITEEINIKINTQNNTKGHINERINEAFKEAIEKSGSDKSKVKHLVEGKTEEWGVGKRHPYLNELTRNQASALFKARTRMIRAKNNERGAHQKEDQLKCRFCKIEEIETQQHILELCPKIHKDETTKITHQEIFAEYDPTKTKETANKILHIIELLEEKVEKGERKTYAGKKYPCVTCIKPCKENQNSIECDECKKWTHLKCTEINNEQFTEIADHPERKWYCQKCTITKQAQDGTIRLTIKKDRMRGWTCQPNQGLTIIIKKDKNNKLKCQHKSSNQLTTNRGKHEPLNTKTTPTTQPEPPSTTGGQSNPIEDSEVLNDSAPQRSDTNNVCVPQLTSLVTACNAANRD